MIQIRPAQLTDRTERGFIASTWIASYDAERAGVSRNVYRQGQPALVDQLLSAPHVRFVVACSENSPRTLHGWGCGVLGSALHYVYVPPELRRSGIARRLIAAALGTYADIIDTTHRWPWGSKRFRFNPYPLALEAA